MARERTGGGDGRALDPCKEIRNLYKDAELAVEVARQALDLEKNKLNRTALENALTVLGARAVALQQCKDHIARGPRSSIN